MKGVIFSFIGVFNGLSCINATYFSIVRSRPDDFKIGIIHFGVVLMGVLYLTGAYFYVK